MTDYTNEQIEEARAIVAAADAKKRVDEEAKRLAFIAPVTDLVKGTEYRAVYEALVAMRSTYEDDGRFSLHVGALADIMPRLAQEIGVSLTLPEPVISPDADKPEG